MRCFTYSASVREAAQAIQASSKIAPNASQNIAVNDAGISASNGIASVAVTIPITAHSPPRIPNTKANIAMLDYSPSLDLSLFYP